MFLEIIWNQRVFHKKRKLSLRVFFIEGTKLVHVNFYKVRIYRYVFTYDCYVLLLSRYTEKKVYLHNVESIGIQSDKWLGYRLINTVKYFTLTGTKENWGESEELWQNYANMYYADTEYPIWFVIQPTLVSLPVFVTHPVMDIHFSKCLKRKIGLGPI